MTIETKYSVGDLVWLVNSKTGSLVQREIKGVRGQYINNKQSSIYAFTKDRYDPNSNYFDFHGYEHIDKDDYNEIHFWVYESRCFKIKEDLIDSLNNG